MGPLAIEESQHRAALDHLQEHGYAVLPRVLDGEHLATLRLQVDAALAAERAAPFDPGDGTPLPDDEASDCSAASIGPGTDDGGAWHVDVPLGQLPEPYCSTTNTS